MTSVRGIWDRLQVEGEGSEGFVRLRHPDVQACAVYAARSLPSGHEALLLELHTASLPADAEFPESAGMSIHAVPLTPGRSGLSRVLLTLTDQRYRDVFQTLAEDVVRGMQGAADEGSAVRLFISRVARWQAFLREHGFEGLSEVARVGLYGELDFLRRVISAGLDPVAGIRAWKGCFRVPHDFQLAHGSVEIKTSRAATPHCFKVSNVQQLNEAGVPALFVHFISVDQSEAGGESLPEAVEAVRSHLNDLAVGAFYDCLTEWGYLDVHRERYATPRYSVRSTRWFRVGNGFPRLPPFDLPEGVENVSYSVALAACAPFEWDSELALNTVLGVDPTYDV